ncbi:hypothetical protein BDZ94DRAFT_1155378, partial [Collybia nuda]
RSFLRKTNHMLQTFHLSATPFLNLLKECDAVISGSAVLLPLLSATFTPGDLDVYVPEGMVSTFIHKLKTIFGYKQATNKKGEPFIIYLDGDETIKRVSYYMKHRKLINIVVVRGENALTPIFSFHSTPVMNFISYYGIYCAYPGLTLQYRGIINNTNQEDPNLKKRYRKLKARGFSLKLSLSRWPSYDGHSCMTSKVCPQTVRSVYDQGSLFYPFPKIRLDKDHKLIYNGKDAVVWALDAGQRCANQNPVMRGFVHSIPVITP